MTACKTILVILTALCLSFQVRAETPEEWIALGTRIHGAFGSFIPVGIRIGVDARERLKAGPRDLTVIYYNGPKAPCPCIVDGIMLATSASPGQGTLQVSPDKGPAAALGVAIIRNKKTGEAVKYTVAEDWLNKLIEFNKTYDAQGRYDAVMAAAELFTAETVGAEKN